MLRAWKLCQSSSISGPLHDAEPERCEDVHDLAFDQRERVQRSRARTPAGERDSRSGRPRAAPPPPPPRARPGARRGLAGGPRGPRSRVRRPRGDRRSAACRGRAGAGRTADLRPSTATCAASSSSTVVAAANAARPRASSIVELRAASRRRPWSRESSNGVSRPPRRALSRQTGRRRCSVSRPSSTVGPRATALRLGHAAHHEQADLRAAAGAGTARLEQRLAPPRHRSWRRRARRR